MPSRPSEIVTAPENFLHHVNIDTNAALFFPTDTGHLRDASFLDGRTPLANGPAEAIAIVDTVDNLLPPRRPLGRYLFNMSFCGSTYIARLLDVPGRALVLKEPKTFTDIAAWKTLQIRKVQDIAAMRPALDLVRAMMFREHSAGERVVVKPACWANNILDELVGAGDRGLALFVAIDVVASCAPSSAAARRASITRSASPGTWPRWRPTATRCSMLPAPRRRAMPGRRPPT